MDKFFDELLTAIVRTGVKSIAKTVETVLIPPKKKATPRRREDD
jgi:hypothetical protein